MLPSELFDDGDSRSGRVRRCHRFARFRTRLEGEQGGTSLDARRMSTSAVRVTISRHTLLEHSPAKPSSYSFLRQRRGCLSGGRLRLDGLRQHFRRRAFIRRSAAAVSMSPVISGRLRRFAAAAASQQLRARCRIERAGDRAPATVSPARRFRSTIVSPPQRRKASQPAPQPESRHGSQQRRGSSRSSSPKRAKVDRSARVAEAPLPMPRAPAKPAEIPAPRSATWRSAPRPP